MFKRVHILVLLLAAAALQVNGQEKELWSLADCIDYALKNNITVKDAELVMDNSEITLKKSQWSRLPNLSGSASQNLSNGTSIDPITSDYVSQQIHSTSFGLSSQVTLYQGSKLSQQIKQNKQLVDQNALYVQEARNNIELSITQAYLQALYNKESIGVAENDLAISEQELDNAKVKFEAGSIPERDVVDAESQVASGRYNVINAKNNYTQQLMTLKQLLELNPEQEFDIRDADLEATEAVLVPSKMDVYNEALANRPEIKSSELNVDISQRDLGIARSSYLPTLSLSGSLGTGYTNTQDMSFADQLDLNFNQRLGLSLSIPIFDKLSTHYSIQSAKISVERAKLQNTTAQKELFRSVELAWQNAISAQDQLLAAEAAETAARSSYDLAQKQHELGGLSTFDLAVAQNTLTNAVQNQMQAKYLSILYGKLLEFYARSEQTK